MVASAAREHRETHVIPAPAPATPDLLRSSIIYGANAAGKSNLISALLAFERLVVSPGTSSKVSKLSYSPFCMDAFSSSQPTRFQVSFVQDGVRYQYGVSFDASRVYSEELYAFPEGRAQKWFVRSVNDAGQDVYEYGSALKGKKKTWEESTRPNALFLATGVDLNSDQLQTVFSWFEVRVRLLNPSIRKAAQYTAKSSSVSEVRKARVIEFMGQADLGISDFDVSETPIDLSVMPEDTPDDIKRFVESKLKDEVVQEVAFVHRSADGYQTTLDLDDESSGTKKLFSIAGPWIDTLEKGYILLIDELDTSLHPLMLQYLVKTFHDPSMNVGNAQLIFTTHDTNVIPLFRRDQVWVMEKDAYLKSTLTPISDFSPRKNENLEKGYLEGRFGGIPILGRPEFWQGEE
jgi:AAA15 family ATPase/GTPase